MIDVQWRGVFPAPAKKFKAPDEPDRVSAQ